MSCGCENHTAFWVIVGIMIVASIVLGFFLEWCDRRIRKQAVAGTVPEIPRAKIHKQ